MSLLKSSIRARVVPVDSYVGFSLTLAAALDVLVEIID